MNKRNSFILAMAFLLGGFFTAVQAQTSFHMHMKGGEVKDFNTDDVDSIVFDAPEIEGTTFDLSYTGLTSTTVTLNVKPADNSVAYYYDCVTEEQLAESDGSIASVVEGYISYLQQTYPTLSLENILGALLSKGPASDDVTGLPAGTDFVFYAIPVNEEGKCYGKPSTVKFSTLPGGDPADCEFDISYTDLTSEGCNMVVNPSDASVRYWMGITPFADYPGDKAMAMNVKESIEQYASEKGMTVAQVVKGVTFTGNCESPESGLDAGTDYYIYAYAMDETGAAAGKVYKQKFTTLLTDYSDADISLKYRYFDGDDLYNLDSEKYAKMKGRVYVQTVITPNDAADNWVLALAKGDYTDEDTYPEESTKNAILQGGHISNTQKNYVADWTTCTFLYFAADAAGVDGALHRLLVTFDKANARPVSEFSENVSASAPARMSRLLVNHRKLSVVEKRILGKTAAEKIHRSMVD